MEIKIYSNVALKNGEVSPIKGISKIEPSQLPKAKVIVKEPYVSYQVGRSKEILPTINMKAYLVKLMITKSILQKGNIYYMLHRKPKKLPKLEVV